jgi:hypothetical protein
MSFTHGQAQDAATPPNDHAPGLSLAQDLLERLICALFGILIVRQINRILARFERMRDAWVAGQLPGLPPPPMRATAAPARPARRAPRHTPRLTPRIRLAPAIARPIAATPAPRPRSARAQPRQVTCARAIPPHPAHAHPRTLPHPPNRFFTPQAPMPNHALFVP